MIAHISGTLIQKTPTEVVVETHGIGMLILIPVSSFNQLCDVGQQIKLLTYLHVREDALQLYGFVTENERQLFRLLISVSGVGPRLAQGILSGISPDAFVLAVGDQDVPALNRIPGVGKKTAERLLLELKDKVKTLGLDGVESGGARSAGLADEAILALVSLGYKQAESERTVRRLLQNDPDLTMELLLKQALQKM